MAWSDLDKKEKAEVIADYAAISILAAVGIFTAIVLHTLGVIDLFALLSGQ